MTDTPEHGTVREYDQSVFGPGTAGGSGYCSFRGGGKIHKAPVFMVFIKRRTNSNGRGAWWAMCQACAERRGETEATA